MPVCLRPEAEGGRDMDPELAGTADPWAPTIDHIRRLADGGTDRDGNLRGAHRLCNQADGDEAQRPSGIARAARPVGGLDIASRIDEDLARRLASLASGISEEAADQLAGFVDASERQAP